MANTININVSKTDLGLNLVDNTADLNKPISTATQTALNGKENVANKSTNTSLGTSDTLYPTQNAVKVYTDNLLGNANALVYKGVIDCSTNPNYPSANAGELYIVSVAGKIGGALGINVEVGDMLICNTDSTASGNEATVGAYWNAIQKNIDGAVTGPASSVNNTVALFDGTTGKLIKQGIITDNGTNIGVEITTPTAKLHINNTGVVNSFLVEDESNPDSTPFIIDNQGRVGIGTINPAAKLQVDGDTYVNGGSHYIFQAVNTNVGHLTLDHSGVQTWRFGVFNDNTSTLSIGKNILDSSNRLFNLTTAGNVGIGTITPTEKLHVNGNIIATNLSGTNTGDQDLSGYATKNITLERKTASYTLVAGDNNKLIEMNVGTANNVTINDSVFTAGNQILVSQYGAGQVTFVAGAGVTLRSPSGKLKLTGQYSLATIIAISATEFYISGDLTA